MTSFFCFILIQVQLIQVLIFILISVLSCQSPLPLLSRFFFFSYFLFLFFSFILWKKADLSSKKPPLSMQSSAIRTHNHEDILLETWTYQCLKHSDVTDEIGAWASPRVLWNLHVIDSSCCCSVAERKECCSSPGIFFNYWTYGKGKE